MSFTSFNFNPSLLKAVVEAGYNTPTPIQAAAIPIIYNSRDLLASAQTGTGKTAAYILPILQRILTTPRVHKKAPRALILVPTRELALQVETATKKYAKYLRTLSIASIVGGVSYQMQYRQLAREIDILIATPGRLIDHIERDRIALTNLDVIILDEADRMLDMGFLPAVEHIISATPKTRQTLMFSATFEAPIAKLAQKLLNNPERVTTISQQTQRPKIEQRLYFADSFNHKKQLLCHFLDNELIDRAIIFTATKHGADQLAENLQLQGYPVAPLHGGMQQRARLRTLNELRRGALQLLVATDVAARGIDVAGLSHIFNYDLPRTAEDYVHRIGRTGRAGASGIAISFANINEQGLIHRIMRATGETASPQVIAGLEPKRTAQTKTAARPFRRNNAKTSAPRGSAGYSSFTKKTDSAPQEWRGQPNSKKPKTNQRFNKADGAAKPEYSRRFKGNQERKEMSTNSFSPKARPKNKFSAKPKMQKNKTHSEKQFH